MRIGEFVRTLNTTLDTVRHYEEIGLLSPVRNDNKKHYYDEHLQAFRTIQELKDAGLSLEDILLLFELKESVGCGSEVLIREVTAKFENQIATLDAQMQALRIRRDNLRGTLDELRRVTQE
ncbi:MerR family transcriptional regulator [Alicyclobacillus sp. ALC3]|uniref:MerR family transcriptional regulator n=1 Tax=Alicyclobacillus sp. ALC3 TaxID=2796143 RepID=UPI002379E88E|nr:MerR family transcriptional regulator [Alicyclobacillus sp. ALC3]WDL98457.1 MerR family transcriptional regulator [Alicyclobacillus sp. ALC3]